MGRKEIVAIEDGYLGEGGGSEAWLNLSIAYKRIELNLFPRLA
ncbi:MAG: hypothetical protein ACTS7E_00710 [Arsenophonus sp. NC-CH8-MAG3]